MTYGVFEVTEGHTFRNRPAGERFEARLDRGSSVRAVNRGVIRLIDTLEPALRPGSYVFPRGWLPQSHTANRGAERRLFHGGKE